jgi:hypothetical protein
MKGAGELTRVHRGRAKLPTEPAALRELLTLDPPPEPETETEPETEPPTDTLEQFAIPGDAQQVHKISVARSEVGGMTVWKATCSCADWHGSMWTDDASPRREFEQSHMAALIG